jgi:small subunit ribosomal protein S15
MHKNETVQKFAHHEKDTGSPEVQIALLTARINSLTDHFKANVKDFAGRRGMLRLVSRRRSLLDYLNRTAPERYSKVLQALNLRK